MKRVRELQQHLDLSKLDEKQISKQELERLGVPYEIVKKEEEEQGQGQDNCKDNKSASCQEEIDKPTEDEDTEVTDDDELFNQ
jgi:hypothetical protein